MEPDATTTIRSCTNAEFDAIDLNDDGLISVTEWDTAFGVWDLNDDGFIAPSEYLLPAGFNTLDADANGLLSQAEWDSASPPGTSTATAFSTRASCFTTEICLLQDGGAAACPSAQRHRLPTRSLIAEASRFVEA